MKMLSSIVGLAFCTSVALPAESQEATVEPPVSIASVDDQVPNVLAERFKKQTKVFGVYVLATGKTPDHKVLHAANVLAQYLDNDADGKPDNARVVQAMVNNSATLVMFATEREAERVIEGLESSEDEDLEELDTMVLQDLYGEETHPGGAKEGVFDASYEEVLHLITHAGYASAYPKVFGERPGTSLCNAMDKARGGRFLKVPRRYPKNAWYSYDDETCGYGCQATEYIYWGLTTLLGAQDFDGRKREIGREWRFTTADEFKTSDPDLYKLLTDEQYAFPTRLPDGKYRP
ncbi:MAG: hypothetical protein AAF483_10235 [Planctomycetota bacterium]